jgi:hypothetical protein
MGGVITKKRVREQVTRTPCRQSRKSGLAPLRRRRQRPGVSLGTYHLVNTKRLVE